IARAHALRGRWDASEVPFDMRAVWEAPGDLRALLALLVFGLRGLAAYAWHAWALGKKDPEAAAFLHRALRAVREERDPAKLLALALEVGKFNFACMGLLEAGNIAAFGQPAPAEVKLGVAKGPFIVVTGHDLLDLKMLLEQTEGTGVNVYTHGEMLPAHGYPELRKFAHLKGHVGTAWHNQQKEFAGIPGALLWTTNCLMPPKASYADRVFTTGPVGFAGCPAVEEDAQGRKDFSAVIAKAKELGGYAEDQDLCGPNGGKVLATGFGSGTILSLAGAVVEAVKSGAVRHFFLVGGCDGAKKSRQYYLDLVKAVPQDCIILTLGCAKFRFNDLELGTIGGIPRLLDMGQCNDAYGAVQVALALANAFGCGVNELPLSLIISWYEQKAVSILLSLLHLGVKGIRLGPTLP
ncbi:MAG: hydroxylamine reductase, partial [Duodenibacillus sp.]|nr:hydroxylamine reductase [Duodenibacillus sp.]